MPDRYSRFAELAADKTEGVDYRIGRTLRDSDVLILAPHGGKIEPGTSEIAEAIAAGSYSVYRFEGCQGSGNFTELHITSENFDEPQALEAVRRSRFVVVVHGYRDTERAFVMVGGSDEELRSAIERSLGDAGFQIEPPQAGLTGRSPENICNRGQGGHGCQLEISRLLRDHLRESDSEMARFAAAVRNAVSTVVGRRSEEESPQS